MSNENEQLEVVETADVSVLYLQDKASIDVQVATAHAFPRNVTKAKNNAIAIVTMDIEIAKTCTYSVPRGGKAITGPSVHLAKIMAQCWGNMRIEAKVVDVGDRQVTSEGVCWDLESNLAQKSQVKRSIMGRTGRFNDDMITVTGNAANSIALRNAVFSVIPRGIVDMVYNAAKAKITGDVSNETKLIARRKQVVDGLKDTYGVNEKEILSAIGKASVDHITADELVVLIGIGTAIKDGDTTVDLAFRGGKSAGNVEPEIAFEDLEALFNLKYDAITEAKKVIEYKRILEAKETKSYKKMHKELSAL